MNEVTIKQQVNLLDKRFRESESVLSGKRIFSIWGGLIALLALYSGYSYYENIRLTDEAATLKVQHQTVVARLDDMTRKAQPGQSSQLENEVAFLNQEKEKKIRINSVLSGADIGNTTGFSGHMEGLARQVVPKIWLKAVRIDEGGKSLGIYGSALDAEIVPRYLQKLSDETAYAGADFKTFIMERPELEEETKKTEPASLTKGKKEKKKLAPQIDFLIQTSLIKKEE